MKNLLSFINNNKYIVPFFVILILFLVHLLCSGKTDFYYDSGQYWELAKTFNHNSNFSLYNYTDNLRGVWFPLLLLIPQSISTLFKIDPLIVWRIFSALYIALFCAYLIPLLIKRIFPEIILSTWKIISFGLLIFFFWRDFFIYPLSDFPAIIFLLWSYYLLLPRKKYLFFVSGIALGIAISIRPIYSIAFLPLILFLFFQEENNSFIKKALYSSLNIAILILGFLFISTPQIIVNAHSNNSYSPMVQTQKSSYGKNLYLLQLIWGLTYEKYETNVGNNYPTASVFFTNKMGEHIAIKESSNNINSFTDYLKVCFKYPIELTCIYSKHLFNGLDIKNYQAYVKFITYKNYFFSLSNYTIWFLFLLIIYLLRKTIINTTQKLFFFILMAMPIIFIIPTAIETRFFIPLFIVFYSIVAFLPNNKELYITLNKSKKIRIVILYLIFLLICFVLSNTTYSNLQYII